MTGTTSEYATRPMWGATSAEQAGQSPACFPRHTQETTVYPSPDLELTIATATQRERVARGWRRPSPRASWSAFRSSVRRS